MTANVKKREFHNIRNQLIRETQGRVECNRHSAVKICHFKNLMPKKLFGNYIFRT